MSRAFYTIAREDRDTLTIRDVGNGTAVSVTNDAEAVVEELHLLGVLRGRRLFYYDSEDRLDELLHDRAGKFLGFAPGP